MASANLNRSELIQSKIRDKNDNKSTLERPFSKQLNFFHFESTTFASQPAAKDDDFILNEHISKVKMIWDKKKNDLLRRRGSDSFITRSKIDGEYVSRPERLDKVNYTKQTHFKLGFDSSKLQINI